jgi:hypothetical protein
VVRVWEHESLDGAVAAVVAALAGPGGQTRGDPSQAVEA